MCFFLQLFGTIYKFSLSQWLSATNKNSGCRSGSVQKKNSVYLSESVQQTILKKIFNLFVAHNKEIEKKQKQISFQIWISPALSNCFGVPWHGEVHQYNKLVHRWLTFEICLMFHYKIWHSFICLSTKNVKQNFLH